MSFSAYEVAWIPAFRSAVRSSCGAGWSVSEDRGSVRLQWRGSGHPRQSVTLPYPWSEATWPDALLRIRQVVNSFDAGGVDLKGAARIATVTSSKHDTDWGAAVAAFREHRARVSDRTWKQKYQPVLSAALQALGRRDAPTNGIDLCDGALKQWAVGMRQRQIMRQSLHAFLRYAVQRRQFKPCWLPPAVDDGEHVAPKRVGYPMTDAQIMRLLDSVPDTESGCRWRYALQLLAVYGLRPEDLRYVHTRAGGAELWSRYQKSQGGRKGARTQPRRLYRLLVQDIDGPVDWRLQQRVHVGEELPPLGQNGKAGEALGTYLRRLPMWGTIAAEAEREGQVLTPYSFRHRYSAEGHRRGLQPKQMADAMGHSLEVHLSSYARFQTRDLAAAFGEDMPAVEPAQAG